MWKLGANLNVSGEMDGRRRFLNPLIRKERVGNRGYKSGVGSLSQRGVVIIRSYNLQPTYEILQFPYLLLKLQRRSPRGHSKKSTRTNCAIWAILRRRRRRPVKCANTAQLLPGAVVVKRYDSLKNLKELQF